MTANELAKKFSEQGMSGTISARQGDWLWSLAQKAGQSETAGQRVAKGECSGKQWTLVRAQGVWIFEAK